MAKRGAGTYLTHNNWDDDEEKEQAGVFKKADDKTLQTRKIKTAKRRGVGEEAKESSGTGGIFKGFTGFTSTASTGTKPGFSFGGADAKPLGGLDAKPLGGLDAKPLSGLDPKPLGGLDAKPLGGLDTKPLGGLGAKPLSGLESKPFSLGSKPDEAKPLEGSTEAKVFRRSNGSTSDKPALAKNGTTKSSSKYMSQLKALNETVSKWIKDHVDKNPYCILTPIFTDYKTHLTEIEKKHGSGESEAESANTSTSSSLSETSSSKADTSKGKEEEEEEGEKKAEEKKTEEKKAEEKKKFTAAAPSSSFSFGSFGSSSSSTSTTTAPFTFGSGIKPLVTSSSGTTSTTSSSTISSTSIFGSVAAPAFTGGGFTFGKAESGSTGGFTFGKADSGGTGGFSFATSKPAEAASGDGQKADEEDEYVPPKPEASNIVEEDAFYTKRCKLFFKQAGDWKDRGVGILYLKPCDGKTQVLIRADTSIGNILLNVMLQKSMPISRQGKNNVMMMCVPNPPLDEKKPDDTTPVGMLIRVKSGEDADQLADKLKELKDK